jgi:hypothetical protein
MADRGSMPEAEENTSFLEKTWQTCNISAD